MKKMLFVLFLTAILFGCEDDSPKIKSILEAREESIGTYSGTEKGYYLVNGTLMFNYEAPSTFSVEKGSDETNIIIGFDNASFTCPIAKVLDKGFVGNIRNATGCCDLTGYPGNPADGTSYDVYFDSSNNDKELTFYFKYTNTLGTTVIQVSGLLN